MRVAALIALTCLTACTSGLVAEDAVAVSTPALEARSTDARTSAATAERGLVERKLIRTGELTVRVDAFEPLDRDVRAWLEVAGGYVSDTSLTHVEGDVSRGTLQLRVPADQLDTLVGWTEERAEVVHLSVRGQDVTAQWVDLSARLDNARRAEQRLQRILGDETGTLADVLAVERELSRVRGDIESWEAQMRTLSHQVELATLTLHVEVERPYTSLVRPSFGAEASGALGASLSAMGAVGRGLAIAAIAASPWLAVLGAVSAAALAGLRVAVRRLSR